VEGNQQPLTINLTYRSFRLGSAVAPIPAVSSARLTVPALGIDVRAIPSLAAEGYKVCLFVCLFVNF